MSPTPQTSPTLLALAVAAARSVAPPVPTEGLGKTDVLRALRAKIDAPDAEAEKDEAPWQP